VAIARAIAATNGSDNQYQPAAPPGANVLRRRRPAVDSVPDSLDRDTDHDCEDHEERGEDEGGLENGVIGVIVAPSAPIWPHHGAIGAIMAEVLYGIG